YGGYRVHYESLRAGRSAVVFVHGLACDSTSWRFQVPALASRSRVVLLDLPGHGQSDKPELFAYTLRSHALALETVLREAGVDRGVLVGHSMGTAVVREFYRLYPQRTAALVAVEGALKPMNADPASVETSVEPYRGAEFPARMEKFADSLLPARAEAPPWRDDIQAVFVHSLEGLLDPAAWKDDPVRVPLLCVVAGNASWGPEYQADVRALGPDVEYRVLEGTSHFLMLEKPAAFNAILGEFLAHRGLIAR